MVDLEIMANQLTLMAEQLRSLQKENTELQCQLHSHRLLDQEHRDMYIVLSYLETLMKIYTGNGADPRIYGELLWWIRTLWNERPRILEVAASRQHKEEVRLQRENEAKEAERRRKRNERRRAKAAIKRAEGSHNPSH